MQTTTNEFGRRDNKEDIKRYLGFLLLILTVILLEYSLGRTVAKNDVEKRMPGGVSTALGVYSSPDSFAAIPPKPADKKRILYVSNSHALTGGRVSSHLQKYLNTLAPEQFEVLDIADPGIFAPDMLQRTLLGLEYKPDAIIVAVSYISFSDRMNLSMQSPSVLSFFKKTIRPKLSLGFWMRNYDIGIYADTFIKWISSLYNYRNTIRDFWEKPVARKLKQFSGDRNISFLEIDEQQRWRFPDGYNSNLFEWRLYAVGRDGHLADIRELVATVKNHDIPLLTLNMPIDFVKSLYSHNDSDFKKFRKDLKTAFAGADQFVDYQDAFPKNFTTYDALHPTWHGARLHAFDILTRLTQFDLFDSSIQSEDLFKVFSSSDSALSSDYLEMLNGEYPPLVGGGMRRYDPSEPSNARKLLRKLSAYPISSRAGQDFLLNLSRRIRFWLERNFQPVLTPDSPMPGVWLAAQILEMSRAKERMTFFRQELANLQQRKLSRFPLAKQPESKPVQSQIIRFGFTNIHQSYYRDSTGKIIELFKDNKGLLIAAGQYKQNKGYGYRRIDILRDGSFVLMTPMPNIQRFLIMALAPPTERWGI